MHKIIEKFKKENHYCAKCSCGKIIEVQDEQRLEKYIKYHLDFSNKEE